LEYLREPRSAQTERLAGQVRAVDVEQVERVEHDAVLGVRPAVLQRLEGRAAAVIDGEIVAIRATRRLRAAA
jgi:hypothetical protein